jgi:hypothetical protein
MLYKMIQKANRHYPNNDRRYFQKQLKMKKEIECHAAMHGCAHYENKFNFA